MENPYRLGVLSAIALVGSGAALAKTAGMYCIGINTSKTPEKLQQANLVIDGFHEIELDNILARLDNKLL